MQELRQRTTYLRRAAARLYKKMQNQHTKTQHQDKMPTAIKIENLSKQYRLGVIGTGTLSHDLNRWWTVNVLRREDPYLKIGETNDRATRGNSEYVWALKDINMEIEQGDVVGIIGKNGAGKSTLLKLLSRVTKPTTGTIKYKGRIASLLEVGTGFHPEMTGRENIYMNGAIMGMTRAEITRKLDEIVDFSGCERYLDTPVKRYSSGMTVRLGFAIAAHLDPEILVVDEVLAVGDAEFQKKAIGKMQDVSKGEGRTVLFVSHNMTAVRNLCKKGVLLENGGVKFSGDIDSAVSAYLKQFEFSNVSVSDMPREGKCSGIIRFEDIEYLDIDKNHITPHSGGYICIKLTINAKKTLSCCNIAVGIRSAWGNPMLNFSTNIKEGNLALSKGTHYVECIIEKLPLTQGHYLVGLWAENDSECADYIDNAIMFDVEEDDFYGTGKMNTGALNGKIVLCDHSWNIK